MITIYIILFIKWQRIKYKKIYFFLYYYLIINYLKIIRINYLILLV